MEAIPPLKVDRTKLITQTEYAKRKSISKQLLQKMMKRQEVKTVEIIGTTLLLLD